MVVERCAGDKAARECVNCNGTGDAKKTNKYYYSWLKGKKAI